MNEWPRNIQRLVDEIDACIRSKADEALSLRSLARRFGYSEYHFSRKFRELSGLSFRDYLRLRRLAFALKRLRDTRDGILEIALDYGFSSHEAFTRAFRGGLRDHPQRVPPKPCAGGAAHHHPPL